MSLAAPKVTYCANCAMPGATQLCSRCELAWYCDADCQVKHWKAEHKHVCGKRTQPIGQAGGGGDGSSAGVVRVMGRSTKGVCGICGGECGPGDYGGGRASPCRHSFCGTCRMRLRHIGTTMVHGWDYERPMAIFADPCAECGPAVAGTAGGLWRDGSVLVVRAERGNAAPSARRFPWRRKLLGVARDMLVRSVEMTEAGERSRLADDEAVHVMNLAAFKHPELVAQYEAELKEFLGQFLQQR